MVYILKISLKIGAIDMLGKLHLLNNITLICFVSFYIQSCGRSDSSSQANPTSVSTDSSGEVILELHNVIQNTLTDNL